MGGGGGAHAHAVAAAIGGRGFVRGEHWAKAFAADEASLRHFAASESGRNREWLLELADRGRDQTPSRADGVRLRAFVARRASCLRLVGPRFFRLRAVGGSRPVAAAWQTLGGPELFSPMEFPYDEGVWRDPLIVLVDRNTASAASEFAAVLQDNRAAIVMGEAAGGGCGHTNGGTPTKLRNSGATLEVPDCARFRSDGSNEVMGIQPDVAISFATVDGPHRRGCALSCTTSPGGRTRGSVVAGESRRQIRRTRWTDRR
jgi:hypothetical protein